jgi:archaellum component FlaC
VLLQAIKELDGKVISLFKGLSDRVQALEARMDKVNGLEKEIHALKEEIRGFKAVNKEIKERVEKLENAKRSK